MIIYQHLPPLKKIPWILEGNLWYRNMLYELKKQQIVRLYNCKRRSVNKFSSLSKTRWRVSTIIILHLFFWEVILWLCYHEWQESSTQLITSFFFMDLFSREEFLLFFQLDTGTGTCQYHIIVTRSLSWRPGYASLAFFFCKVICLGKEKWNAIEFLIRYN